MRKICFQDGFTFHACSSCAIAFDPGLNRTGYCVWSLEYNHPVEVGALITTRYNNKSDKLQYLAILTKDLLSEFDPQRVIVEEFVDYVPRDRGKARDLMSCGAAQGLIFGVASNSKALSTNFYCKGSIKKEFAAMVAKQFGVTVDSKKTDEYDAVFMAFMVFGKGGNQ